MNPLPKVSILIPTYGQQDCISDAISSALAQSYPNLEVIVVDDASPDNTAEKVAIFRDPRLHYKRNAQNLGRVKNYRRALYELATGEWVVNLDGDDCFIDPEFISNAVALACSVPGIVIVSARYKTVTEERSFDSVSPETAVMSGKEVLLHYHDIRYHFPHLATLYYRRGALNCNFYRMDVISSDWESLLRLALTGKVAYLDHIVGCWNLHGANISLCSKWYDLAENLKIWDSIYQTASDVGIPQKALDRARHATLRIIACHDISLIYKKESLSKIFYYLYHGLPILKITVVFGIILRPNIWVKLAKNIYRIIVSKIIVLNMKYL